MHPLWFDFASGASIKLDPFQDSSKDGKGKQTYHKVFSVNNTRQRKNLLGQGARNADLAYRLPTANTLPWA